MPIAYQGIPLKFFSINKTIIYISHLIKSHRAKIRSLAIRERLAIVQTKN
jgi:hypothetical protein